MDFDYPWRVEALSACGRPMDLPQTLNCLCQNFGRTRGGRPGLVAFLGDARLDQGRHARVTEPEDRLDVLIRREVTRVGVGRCYVQVLCACACACNMCMCHVHVHTW